MNLFIIFIIKYLSDTFLGPIINHEINFISDSHLFTNSFFCFFIRFIADFVYEVVNAVSLELSLKAFENEHKFLPSDILPLMVIFDFLH